MNQINANSAKKRTIKTFLPVLAGYLLLSFLFTRPLITDLRKYVISEHLDVATAFYNLWWFRQAVCILHTSPWTNPLIDFPDGYSMILFPMWLPYDLLGLPFLARQGAQGLPLAFNLISLFAMAAAGAAGFVFVTYITKNREAAFLAGLVAAFAPYRLWNLTRWHVSCLELIILSLHFFLRLLREPKSKAWIGFAVCFSLLAYTSPNYAGDMILGLSLVLGFVGITERETLRPRPLVRRLLSSGLLAFLLCSPLILRLLLEVVNQPVPLRQPDSLRVPYSANLLGFFSPGANLRAYAWLAPRLPYPDLQLRRAHGIAGYEIFMGWTVLALAALGILKRWRESRLFLLLAVFFIILSLGPELHLAGRTFSCSMPYEWLSPLLPWLQIDRTPVRHSALALVAMTALAGLGVSAVTRHLSPRPRKLTLAVLGLAILFEFNQAPLQLNQIPLPSFVARIKKDPLPGSVLCLPFLPDIKRLGGYHQMHHGKPLAFQLTSRIDDPRYQSGALFRYLDRPRLWLSLSGAEREKALHELRAEMARRQVRWLEVFPKFMEPEDLAGLRRIIPQLGPAELMADDGIYLVYRLGP